MTVEILVGDCRDVLKTIPDESVNCCVTSPPYFGLRDYGTGTWEGGQSDCQHSVGDQIEDSKWQGAIVSGQRPGVDSSRCKKCGAIRIDSQLGLEQTPEEYVAQMVAVFREVKRILKPDGTLWLNIGDSYTSSGGLTRPHPDNSGGLVNNRIDSRGVQGNSKAVGYVNKPNTQKNGLKPKDLIGIPWRLAFALQADGWYLRQDIIWSKPNAKPESVKDRCTKSHEYIFLLSKSARYYFDYEAIMEPSITGDIRRPDGSPGANALDKRGKQGEGKPRISLTRKELRTDTESRHRSSIEGGQSLQKNPNGMRQKRSVWNVNTKPYKGSHFAVFPPTLIEPCILAGCPENGIVLDPFGGSGTVGMVAQNNNRNAILIELNKEYVELIKERTAVPRKLPIGLSE